MDARLIARLLYERERLGDSGAFRRPPAPGMESIRMLVRNRLKLCTLPENARTALAEGRTSLGPAARAAGAHASAAHAKTPPTAVVTKLETTE